MPPHHHRHDRLSAFDVILTAIPLQGRVATQTARYWFEETADICPNHVLDYPTPNVVVAPGSTYCRWKSSFATTSPKKRTTSTSVLTKYRTTANAICMASAYRRLRDNEKLPEAIITPTSQGARWRHDEPLTRDEHPDARPVVGEQWTLSHAMRWRCLRAQ